jgi:hypothetical protein
VNDGLREPVVIKLKVSLLISVWAIFSAVGLSCATTRCRHAASSRHAINKDAGI